MKFRISSSLRNFLILIVVAFFIKTSILEIYVVPTGSMLDTIEINDAIIGNKFIYGLRTPNWLGIPFTRIGSYIPSFRLPAFKEINNGDISIFEFPNDDYVKYVKRCIGLPGQFVEIQNGRISLGSNNAKLEYRQDLTFPPNSRFTKENIASLGNTAKNFFNNGVFEEYTEKSIFQIRSDETIFPYYKPVHHDGYSIINSDNMKLQVPYKGMKLDLLDDELDFYAALSILLLDGRSIELDNYNYSADNGKINIDKLRYKFHKYDYESMAQTSITIKNWFTGIGKGRLAIPIMLLTIIYTAFVLFNRKKQYSNKKKISQSVFCLIVVVIILSISNRDMVPYSDMNSIAYENISNDINNRLIPLTWFFDSHINSIDYTVINSNHPAKEKLDIIRKDIIDIQGKQSEIDSKLNRILNHDLAKSYVGLSNDLYYALQKLDYFKEYSINELNRMKQYPPKLINEVISLRKLSYIKKYFKNSVFRYKINSLLDKYFKFENTLNYNAARARTLVLKYELLDNIIIDGEKISEQSNFTLKHDYYFMVGDNHNNSKDSRAWGFVPDYNLLGQPVISLVNFEKLKLKLNVHL